MEHTECEICGSKNANRKISVDGVILNVCDRCVKFGVEIVQKKVVRKKVVSEIDYDVLVDDFSRKIISRRTEIGISRKELARQINESESVIRRIEHGWNPPINVIEKLEKVLNISLREKVNKNEEFRKPQRIELTIGDIAEIKA